MMIYRMFLLIFFIIAVNNGFGDIKVLFVGAPGGKTLTIDRIYPFPGNRTPRFAFCCDRGEAIIIYDGNNHRAKVFKTALNNLMDTDVNTLHFVTFCWDLNGSSNFAMIYTAGANKRVFYGKGDDLEGKSPEILKNPDEVTGKAVSFNYYDRKLSYIDLESGHIYELIKGKSPRLLYYSPKAPLLITQYTITSKYPGVPYFVLRNGQANNSGIYKGQNFERVVDDPHRDELYPHLSNNGKLLGYIERETKEGSAVVCLITPSGILKSGKSFALEENAPLHEYPRMQFLSDSLYYYISVPDVFATKTPQGLTFLSKQKKGEYVWQPGSEISVVKNYDGNNRTEKGKPDKKQDECFNLYKLDKKNKYHYLWAKKAQMSGILPYQLGRHFYFLVLLRVNSSIWDNHEEKSLDGFIDTVILCPSGDWNQNAVGRIK